MNKISNKKKSQGEIFGIALFFVIIIIGIIMYGRFKTLDNLKQSDAQKEKKYQLLAEGTLNTILKLSTGCYAERDKDTLKDLINFCLYSSNINDDPEIVCDEETKKSCSYAIEIINGSLHSIFSKNNVIGQVPFEFEIELPEFPNANINLVLTNQKEPPFEFQNSIDRRKKGYKKAPSGRISWATSKRNINFNLFLYYKS